MTAMTMEKEEQLYGKYYALPPIQRDENGILTLTLPKAEHAKARQVKVLTKTPTLV